MRGRALLIPACIIFACNAAYSVTWREGSCRYRRSVEVTSGYRSDAATFSFYHGGRAREDGADIRVYGSDGKKVSHTVLQQGPGDFLRIVFRSDGKAGRYYLYYGNADARPPRGSWEPQGGLILETRSYKGGTPSSLPAMRDIIKKSRPSYGKGFVKNVFHGVNVFGPHKNYVSIYQGTIYAPSSGKYIFCTSSDDASFLLVDGKLVVSWPGWHGPVADTRHNASINLSAGAHEFEYLHVNGGGTGVAVAAWQHPAAAKIWPIPAEAFGKPGRGKAGPVEVRGARGAADFQCSVTAEAVLPDGSYIVKLGLSDTAGMESGTRWEFGDGLEGRGRVTEHVYLAEGEITIKMKNKYGECENRVSVTHRYWMDMSPVKSLADLAPAIRTYDFEKLDAKYLKRVLEIFQKVEDAEGCEAVMKVMVARAGEADPDTVAESAVTLSRSMSYHSPRGALELLTGVEKPLEAAPSALARVLLAEGDVHFYFLDDSEKALELYDRVVSRFAGKVQEHTVRIAKIRIGDLYRKQGNYEKAFRAYRDAERLKIHPWPEDRLAVRKGALFMEIENYLSDGSRDAAAESLDTLEWEYPVERLRGESSLMRGRIALGRKNYAEAYKQFMAFVNVNPSSEYAAECLYLAALIREKEGRKDEAAALRKRIVEEYPESPRAAELTE